MHGLHLIADLHDCRCPRPLLTEVGRLRQLCLEVCQETGLTVVGECFHQFASPTGKAGATGALVLAESHLAVHTWPELHAATLDLYVCNFSQDHGPAARAAFARLLAAFQPQRVEQREIRRGELGGTA
jgi:spermidine synthase/S-adenosylmethionine decarboxylase